MGTRTSCITALLITLIKLHNCDDRYGGDLKQNEEMCSRLGINAYFDPEMVVKTKWRIFYTWNLRLSFGCLDMTFKHVNPLIINRFYSDMHKHLETQPVWEAASLLVTMGYFNHQMLLFSEPGPAGKFIGIPNISQRAIEMLPHSASVPLLKFQLKLIRDGKFLLMMDCHIGAVSLSARFSGEPPSEQELAEAVAEAGLGDGFSACMKGDYDWEWPPVACNRSSTRTSFDKFLLMMDYHIGTVSLSARYSGEPPSEQDLVEAYAETGLGDGFSAYMKGKLL